LTGQGERAVIPAHRHQPAPAPRKPNIKVSGFAALGATSRTRRAYSLAQSRSPPLGRTWRLGTPTQRTRLAADPAHVEAQVMLERAGGTEELSAMYDRLLSVLADRPSAKIVATKCGEVEQAYRRLLESLA
jgi:hypothetical protein